MRIDAFEDSNNMQENLLKQLKYFPGQGDNLLQTCLCGVYFSLIKLSSPVMMWDILINLWEALANECAQGRAESAVIL